MRFQFTHFISIYEIIKNPHDGGKMITLEKKKNNWKNHCTHHETEQQFNWAEHRWLSYDEETTGSNWIGKKKLNGAP